MTGNNKVAKLKSRPVLDTAVLLIVFNRIDTTKLVFEAIRLAKPPRLYVASDGAREFNSTDDVSVREVRNYIISSVDWDCEVFTLFGEQNSGCKVAVSEAINWFFQNEVKGIILEDDCLPSQSFFWFCEELLEKYLDDTRVGQISGFNYGYENSDLNYDYFFSKYGFIWGWASWRRAWKKYDIKMNNYEECKKIDLFENYFSHDKKAQVNKFESVYSNKLDTWDYQWSYARFINNLYTIVPQTNLIKNIGFGDNATHTFGVNPYEHIKNEELKDGDLIHPNYFIQLRDFYKIFDKRDSIFRRIKRRLKR